MFKFADADLGTRSCYDILQSSSLQSNVMSSKPAEFLGVMGRVKIRDHAMIPQPCLGFLLVCIARSLESH